MGFRSLTPNLTPQERVIFAYDRPSLTKNDRGILFDVRHETGMAKFGPIAITAQANHSTVAEEGIATCALYEFPYFYDGKFNDILSTNCRTIRNLVNRKWPPSIITGHIRLDKNYIASMLAETKMFPKTILAGIALLSDYDGSEFKSATERNTHFLTRAKLLSDEAKSLGVTAGLVCSNLGMALLNKKEGLFENLIRIAVGVRPKGSPARDHTRIMTPTQAIEAGADYVVIGEPIMGAGNPTLAARAIVHEIEVAL